MSKSKILILFLLAYNIINAIEPKEYAINLKVRSSNLERYIKLNWTSNNEVKNYTLKRLEYINKKLKWVTLIENTSEDSYEDRNLSFDRIYEYRIENHFGKDSIAYGYAVSTLNAFEQNDQKNLLLLVDDVVYNEIPNEINNYKKTLICDNYKVYFSTAPRAENFDTLKLKQTKQIVNNILDSVDLDYIILFGRIAVAYSGALTIDGHPDHFGAYPADVYYVLADSLFTDSLIESTSASLQRNRNVPYDGKFDMTNIPTEVKIAIGRIDFYNLPIFKESEIELYKRYIQKVEDYKYCRTKVNYASIINDELGVGSLNEAWGAEGYINSYSLVNHQNIFEHPFVNNLFENNYFISYASGYSSYQHIGNIIGAKELAENNINCIINGMFGSYFGDWDYQNALLRCAIASAPSTLISFYGGRPFWHLYRLNLGETIGEVYKESINNYEKYKTSQLYGSKMVHISLMGDPTIRMYNSYPVENFRMKIINGVKYLFWDYQPDNSVIIYRAKGIDGDFEKINQGYILENEFTIKDDCDDCVYMAKNVPFGNIETNSAYYFRHSTGVICDNVINVEEEIIEKNIKVINQGKDLELISSNIIEDIIIYNSLGEIIFQNEFANNSNSIIISNIIKNSGVYFCKINNQYWSKIMIY